VISVTDATGDINGISEVNLKIDRVDLHSTTAGWVTASANAQTYNLLALNASAQSKVFADVKPKVGTYDQVRIEINSVTLRKNSGAMTTAKLPLNTMTMNTNLVVNESGTSDLKLDFLASNSIHPYGSNQYIFAPVVATTTQSGANLSIDATGVITIAGGRIDSTNSYGMDVDGSVKLNFQIDPNAKLQVGTGGTISINGTLNTGVMLK